MDIYKTYSGFHHRRVKFVHVKAKKVTMNRIIALLVLCVCADSIGGQLVSSDLFTVTQRSHRSIAVDYDSNTFLLDGKPFRYISGSFHYFRATPESWRRIIRLLKAAGLNAVSTYVEWSLHNPRDGEYHWTGIADLESFIEICRQEDMFVLLRPGPYICAERDLGGFPTWLSYKYPSIQLRTTDPDYLREVERWYQNLMPRMQKHLYGRGGNIILVQVENEYGSLSTCDYKYTYWLKDLTHQYVLDDALLYTTDGGADYMLRCGHINGTVQTIDFGSGENVPNLWQKLRRYYPRGPLVNSEFYAGWLSHWQENFPYVPDNGVAKTLNDILETGGNVNVYMFYGGTNFGYTSGANLDNGYKPQTTSYDYDAPLNEAGDVTSKYWAIRNVTARYTNISMDVPENEKKLTHPEITLEASASLLTNSVRREICNAPRSSHEPLTFEQLQQKGGLVIYETALPKFTSDPVLLSVKAVLDRAHVYVDKSYVGILSRQQSVRTLAFSPNNGNKLLLVVEDQGRVNYGSILDQWKGVTEVAVDGKALSPWNSTACPLDGILVDNIRAVVRQYAMPRRRFALSPGPIFFIGQFFLNQTQVLDTFLDLWGWSKGIVFINGHNLGRYWASVKPQRTLYVPKEFLKLGANEIILLEYQPNNNLNRTVEFIDHPLL